MGGGAGDPSTGNIGIGGGALNSILATGATYNVAIGRFAAGYLTTGNENVAIGYATMIEPLMSQAIALGASSHIYGSRGVAIGFSSVANMDSVAIGSYAGNTSATNSIFIGNGVGPSETTDFRLHIGSTTTSGVPLIYGEFDNDYLKVNGDLEIAGTLISADLDLKAPLASPHFTGTATAENVVISGDLTVSGTTTTVNTQTLSVEDNLIYLNAELDRNVLHATYDTTTVEYEVDSLSGVTAGEAVRITGITPSDYNIASSDNITVLSTRTSGGKYYFTVTKTVSVSYTSGGVAHFKRDVNIDLGFAGGYNDGTYHHAGLFRDASDNGKWKFFQGYVPEPDENINIDTSDTSFALAPIVVSGIESVDATFTGTVTLPAGTVTNIMLAGSITNAKLTNSKVTLGTTDVSLGATATTITGLSSVSSASFTGDLTGNASTATKLAATKNINGVAFDGSADITVTADATTLTGTSLKSTVVGSSLTSVGTISTGVWNGSVIEASYIDTAIARLAGPTFTGTVSAPTPTAGDDSTKVATTAYVQADNLVQYVTVSGTSATIDSTSHKFKVIVCTSSSAVTISIPTDASDNWPIGSYVNVRQMGTGQITVSAATPATTTVVATDSQLKTRVQYSEIVLEKTAADTWLVAGDTTA